MSQLTPSENAAGPRSFLLRVFAGTVGLFAVWQLVYLPAANLIDFVPRRQNGPDLEPIKDGYQKRGSFTTAEPLQRAAEYTGDALDFWTELTGQEQGWSLFAPGTPPHSVFIATEFRFADGRSDTVLSQFEPLDKVNPPIRAPLIHDRPMNFEVHFIYPVWFASPEMVEKFPDSFRDVPNEVRAWRKQIRAYLSWQLKRYRAANPERGTPSEVILKHRYIPTPKPGERGWTQPVSERPYAHWRLSDDSLSAYDIVNKQFVLVEAKP
ncbi:MAG: hypothetical protein L0241_09665 [Planctomycetia bacterium]|nr:hypothetical protein [Planctomycetia bacterium]